MQFVHHDFNLNDHDVSVHYNHYSKKRSFKHFFCSYPQVFTQILWNPELPIVIVFVVIVKTEVANYLYIILSCFNKACVVGMCVCVCDLLIIYVGFTAQERTLTVRLRHIYPSVFSTFQNRKEVFFVYRKQKKQSPLLESPLARSFCSP